MAETITNREAIAATHAADTHLAYRKARTGKWLSRGFAGLATSVLTFVAGVTTGILVPPIGAGLILVSMGAAVYGGVSMAIGIGSGIVNTIRR